MENTLDSWWYGTEDMVNLKKLFNARKSASLKARVAIVRKNKAVQKKAPAFQANV